MSWSIGFDNRWNRDIGYGVPAICDHPDCNEAIDRGLAFVCCKQLPYGGPNGCGLYFCPEHHVGQCGECERCVNGLDPFDAKPDTAEWINFKLTDESWAQWRVENTDEVSKMTARIFEGFFYT